MKSKLFFTVLMLLLGTAAGFAQFSLKNIVDRVPDLSFPFDGNKNQRFLREFSYAITEPNLKGRLYEDIQGKIEIEPDFEEEGYGLYRKFAIPNSVNKLLVIALGGVTDYNSYQMVIVNPSGVILDQMECAFSFFPLLMTKQFRILANGNVVITQLVPTTTTPVLFKDFTSFTGYRVDKTYKINSNGKFELLSTDKFNPQTYTREQLLDRNYNLWQGTETLAK